MAQSELEAVLTNLKEKQQMLASVEEKIAALQKSYDESVNEKERLETNMALTQARLKRAGKLTTALADEKTRWEESVAVSQLSYVKHAHIYVRWPTFICSETVQFKNISERFRPQGKFQILVNFIHYK